LLCNPNIGGGPCEADLALGSADCYGIRRLPFDFNMKGTASYEVGIVLPVDFS